MSAPNLKFELDLAASAITPFTADASAVDEGALRRQFQRFLDAGLTTVWLVSSGTAERNVLTDAEVDRIVDIAVEELGGRLRVYAMGTEPYSARENIDFAHRMLERGIDGVQVGTLEPGHSYQPSERELRTFFDEVLDAIDGPCWVATHVSSGYEAPPEVLVEAARAHDNVVGINATHFRNLFYAPRLLELAGDDVPVIVGSPLNALDSLLQGASGIMSSFDANTQPRFYRALGDAWATRDLEAVAAAYLRLTSMFGAILGGGGLVVAKAILDQLGLPAGPVRPPRARADDTVIARATEIIERFELVL
jgi:4-hydroxy-tetrahydrodipicolinate synthase